MAAIAVRKKVVSIGKFSPSFFLQSLQFYVLIALKSKKNRTEPNEVDELKYSKSLTQMTSYAH